MSSTALVQLIRIRRAQTKGRKPFRKRLPRQVYPSALERQYAKDVVALTRRVHAIIRRDILPHLATWIAQARRERGDSEDVKGTDRRADRRPERQDASGKDTRDAMKRAKEKAKKALSDGEVEDKAQEAGRRVANQQKAQLGRQLQAAVGVDVLMTDKRLQGRLETFAHENVQLIQSVPDRLLGEVEYRVLDAMGRGTRAEDLAKEIEDRFDVSDSRAELIARDQVGKLYGQLNKDRQEGLGLETYIWRTALDERVRPEHQEREGEHFSWDEPPEDGHPGEPIQCRCYAEPDIQEILDELE